MSIFRADQISLGPLPEMDAGVPAQWSEGSVLLTGATGLLGSALLESMLASTEARVVCLVRGSSDADAESRLRKATEPGELAVDWDRVEVVRGDLAMDDLGLDGATMSSLGERVDLILHAGAAVAWWGDPDIIASTNLDSLRTLIRLAATLRPKRLAFVSTCAVVNADAYAHADVVHEMPLVDDSSGLRSPYVQSKWAGERIVGEAGIRGVTTSILRVPYLLPHTRHPRPNLTGSVDLLLGASMRLGAAPSIGPRLPVCPTDEAATMAVRILNARPPANSIHHVAPYESVPWPTLLDAAGGAGVAMDRLDPETWFEAAYAAAREDEMMRPIVGLLGRDPTRTLWSNSNVCRVRFDRSRTQRLLPDLPPTRPLAADCLRGFVRAVADWAIPDGGPGLAQARPPE